MQWLRDSHDKTLVGEDAKTSRRHRKKLKLLAKAVSTEEVEKLRANIGGRKAARPWAREGATWALLRWNSG